MFEGCDQFPRAFKVKNAMTPRILPLTPLPSELRYVEESNVYSGYLVELRSNNLQ
jgi:hypothetical protein